MLIDSHCHLVFDAFQDDLAEVIARAAEAGVTRFINPATNLKDSCQIVTMSQQHPGLFACVGFHPNDAADFDEDSLAQLRELAARPKVVAVGEIGLDYYWGNRPRPVQIRLFERNLPWPASWQAGDYPSARRGGGHDGYFAAVGRGRAASRPGAALLLRRCGHGRRGHRTGLLPGHRRPGDV